MQMKTRLASAAILLNVCAAAQAERFPNATVEEQNACALVGAMLLTGAKNVDAPRILKLCNNTRDKDLCAQTMAFIRFTPTDADTAAGRLNVSNPVPKELHCNGYRNAELETKMRDELHRDAPLPQQVQKGSGHDACMRMSASILVNAKDPNGELPKWIAQCNADHAECEDIKGFIKMNNEGKVPAYLTCR